MDSAVLVAIITAVGVVVAGITSVVGLIVSNKINREADERRKEAVKTNDKLIEIHTLTNDSMSKATASIQLLNEKLSAALLRNEELRKSGSRSSPTSEEPMPVEITNVEPVDVDVVEPAVKPKRRK